jgi:hypothetical protein
MFGEAARRGSRLPVTDLSPATALLQAQAVRWVDTEGWPWVVEVSYTDANGQPHSIVDKNPQFTYEDDEPGPGTELPALVLLECTVVSQSTSGWQICVGHRSVSDQGRAYFVVPPRALRMADSY